MSGGSYDYLFNYRIANYRRADIDRMAARFDELGLGDTWAARKTREVIALIDDANQRIAQLSEAWRAVEWHDSNDYNEDQVAETVASTDPSRMVNER